MNVVREGLLAKPARRATLALMALLVLLVRGDHPDLRDQWDSLDLKAPLALLGKTDYLDILGSVVRLVSKARQVHLVLLVSLVLRVPQERRVLSENVVTLVLLGLRENKVCQGQLGKKEQRVILVQLVLPGRMVHRVSEDSLESVDFRDPLVRSV